MRKEIDRKILHFAMIEIEGGGSSLCEIDTVVRIEDDEKKLFECKYCVFKDMLVCPHRIKCMIDSLIRVDSKGVGSYSYICKECTVADIVREDMVGTVFCPLMMKRDLEFRVK